VNSEQLWSNTVTTWGWIAFAALLILFFMSLEGRRKEMNPGNFAAFICKHRLAFSVALIVVGLAFLYPILNGSQTLFWFIHVRAENYSTLGTTTLRSAFFNLWLFLYAAIGLSLLIVGLMFTLPFVRGGIQKWRTKQKQE